MRFDAGLSFSKSHYNGIGNIPTIELDGFAEWRDGNPSCSYTGRSSRKNQDRYRYIIEGHIVRIYDILKTSEGIDMIDELLVKVTQSYKDYTRQFASEEEQMSDPLFLQTFNKVNWKAIANAVSSSRVKPTSIKSESSKFSRKLKLSKSFHSSCKTMDDVIRNRTTLATLQARAQYLEKEKQVELELDRTRLEKEIAIAKATEKVHQEFLNDDYELNSLDDKNIRFSKDNDNVMADSFERKPALSHFHDEYANTKMESEVGMIAHALAHARALEFNDVTYVCVVEHVIEHVSICTRIGAYNLYAAD